MNFQKAVIWDLDGTLIESVSHHWEAWRGAMQSHGFHLTHEQFVEDFGRRNDEILRHRLGEHLTEDELTRIAQQKEELYRASVRATGIDLLPGVRFWLEYLHANNWGQAVGTSAPRRNVETIFDVLGIHRFFAGVSASEDVVLGKPHPDVFLVAAQQLDVEPPHCIVIEDAPAGIEAGRRAGMKTIGVRTTHPDLEGDFTVQSLADLPRDFFDRFA